MLLMSESQDAYPHIIYRIMPETSNTEIIKEIIYGKMV